MTHFTVKLTKSATWLFKLKLSAAPSVHGDIFSQNTAGNCMVFTYLVHFTHWHLVGGRCSQDHLFRLARLKAVIYHECIASPQMVVWQLQPAQVRVMWPLRLSQCMDDCESLRFGLTNTNSQLVESQVADFTKTTVSRSLPLLGEKNKNVAQMFKAFFFYIYFLWEIICR